MNHQFLTGVAATLMAMALSACSTMNQPPKTPAQNSPADAHSSKNSIDWQGIYKGVVPCADCEGIATELQLLPNGTYTLSTQYLGKGKQVFVNTGSFTWNAQGSAITLLSRDANSAPDQYQVGENQLFQLDADGQRITGELARQYILTKATAMPALPVENKKWQLIELNGQAVKGSAQTHYLMLSSDKHQVSAKAGCNTMFGGYDIEPPQLHFKQLASTMMACENMADENALANALGMTDNYTVSGNTLILNKALLIPSTPLIPLARFQRIESE
jgi:heat shock protein HslJ